MEYKRIKELATNYFYESAFWDTMEEYLNEFDIISEKDIKTFKFLFRIESNKMNREQKVAELEKVLNNCISFKAENIKDNTRFIIFHPCTRPNYKYQLSYFDKLGAIMDEKSNTIDDVINNFLRNYDSYKITEVI